MAIDRLSGGLTPADGSDPRTFPTIFNDAADLIEQNESDISSLDGRVSTAEGDITGLDSRVGVNEGDISQLQEDVTTNTGNISTNAGNIGLVEGDVADLRLEFEDDVASGFRLAGVLYFTADGDFEKDDPFDDGNPDDLEVRAVRVRVIGGGGSGGGQGVTTATQCGSASGGGAGGYAEALILADDLTASVSVDVGAGGAGPTGDVDGNAGATSSFGLTEPFEVAAGGGGGGLRGVVRSTPRLGTEAAGGAFISGDRGFSGERGDAAMIVLVSDGADGLVAVRGGKGGSTRFGSGGESGRTSNGGAGSGFGSGGGGASNRADEATTRTGGNGADGIVIVEVLT